MPPESPPAIKQEEQEPIKCLPELKTTTTSTSTCQEPSETEKKLQKTGMDIMATPRPSPPFHHMDVDYSGERHSSCDSNITLWQFLLELLRTGDHPNLIQWTNNEGEFKLLDAEAVAKLWGIRKAKPHMNYDKLSRALRYYYDKDIIKKVIGQKFVYRFVEQYATNDPSSFSLQTNRALNLKMEQKDPKDMVQIKTEFPDSIFDSHTMALMSQITPMRYGTNDHLASLNVSGCSTTATETPSPTESSCSPNSVGSAAGLSTMHHMAMTPSSSRPDSAHSDDSGSRKRKAESPVKEKSSEPSQRKQKPGPLNLSATQYLNPTLPIGVISPLNIMSQMSPFLMSQQLQFYALASASMYGPNSPMMQAMSANSPFRSPLSTPKTSQQQPIFQFPPVTTAASSFASILSPQNLFPSMGSSTAFKFPSDSLKTPTINVKTQVPVVNKDL